MSQSSVAHRPVALGDRAVGALITELTRHGGPKTGLIVDVTVDSPVLTAAIEALLPDDHLTLVAGLDAGAIRGGRNRDQS